MAPSSCLRTQQTAGGLRQGLMSVRASTTLPRLFLAVFIILVISGNIMKLFSSAIHYSDPYLKRESLEYSSIRVYEIIALHEYITKVVCVCQYDLIRLFE